LQESRRRNLPLSRTLFACTFLAATLAVVLARAPAPRAAEPRPPDAKAPPPPPKVPLLVEEEEDEDAPEPPSFPRDVMTTLGRYCEPCHGARQQHGGLKLDSYDSLMRGGEHGKVIIPGDPKKSLLVAKIEHRNRPVMPPRRKLPDEAIAKIRAWVLAGAQP
jgi:hypothetical protein